MENRPKLALIALFIVLSFASSYAQPTNRLSDQLTGHLNALTERMPSDLIYIQTSKGIYETEEDVWFKAYALDAQFLDPSSLSKILYVQLVHEKSNRVVWQEKYELVNGFSEGHIYLDDSLLEGNYLLMAFSASSINAAVHTLHASGSIKVVKNIGPVREVITDSVFSEWGHFHLFPEGGNLVLGLPAKLAFKAIDQQGKPMDVKGILYENDRPLIEFESVHAGMGSLDFVPKEGMKYRMKVTGGSKDSTFLLSAVYEEGVSMQLTERNDEYATFNVYRSKAFEREKLYFRVQVRGIAYGIAVISPKQASRVVLPLGNLPQGIAELTLFNGHFEPIVERLFYVNANKKLRITTTLTEANDKSFFETRTKARLKIQVSDPDGKPVVGHFGISVFEKIFDNTEDSQNILTHYYLSTQLKGKVYDPGYYFNENHKDRMKALDLLLLTQGWRRYVWQEANLSLLGDDPEGVIRDGLSGKVTARRKRSRKSPNYPTLMAYTPLEKGVASMVAIDSSSGSFTVTPEHLKIGEGGYTYIKYFPQDGSKYDVRILDNSFKVLDNLRKNHEIIYPGSSQNPKANERTEDLFRAGLDVVKLDQVVVTGKRRNRVRDKYFGKLDSLAKLHLNNDYVCKDNILNCPVHTIDAENIKPVEGGIYFELQILTEDGWKPGAPSSSNPVFRNPPLPPYRYPELSDEDLLNTFNLVRTKGYYPQKEFYQPNHEEYHDPAPDYRNTLLWAPSVMTDENGEATLTFFCSDLNAPFIGRVEGVDGAGLIGFGQFEFLVIK